MKLLALLNVFLVFIIVDCKRPNPSFLQYVGSYSKCLRSLGHDDFLDIIYLITDPGEDGVRKNYYMSQRIQYNWFGAYSFCKLNGMKLAKIADNKKQLEALFTTSNHSIPASFYIDTSVLNQTLQSCFKFSKHSSEHFETIKLSEWKRQKDDFLCEEVEGEEVLTESATQEESIAKNNFFNFVGDYGELNKLLDNILLTKLL